MAFCTLNLKLTLLRPSQEFSFRDTFTEHNLYSKSYFLFKLIKAKDVCLQNLWTRGGPVTNHGEQPLSTLHSQRVQELLCLQPLLKQVGDTEVLSVPPLYLHLAKKRNSRSKTQEAVAVWAIRAMYKGHLLALDSFSVQNTEKRCKYLRRNSLSIPLSLLLVTKCCGSLPEAL